MHIKIFKQLQSHYEYRLDQVSKIFFLIDSILIKYRVATLKAIGRRFEFCRPAKLYH